MKTNLHKERVKLRNVKVTDLFPGYSNAVSSNVPLIFLNENLTVYRRELVSRASEMKKDRLLTSFWTMDGKIFVKTSPSGNPVRIFSDYDLDNFVNNLSALSVFELAVDNSVYSVMLCIISLFIFLNQF